MENEIIVHIKASGINLDIIDEHLKAIVTNATECKIFRLDNFVF